MMQIFLPDNFVEDREIVKIYSKLARKIYDSNSDITCLYEGNMIALDSIDKIKKFLLAKDFYKYDFTSDVSPFILDFIKLPANIKLKSVLGENKATRNFKSKYDEQVYLEYYEILRAKNENDSIKTLIDNRIFVDLTKINTLVDRFSYKKLTNGDRHCVISKMEVFVCPYCNINYTNSYNTDKSRRTTADLDHFYIQSIYPQYSLCLYNFVPSCSVCNSRLKGATDMNIETHLYPHDDSFKNNGSKFIIEDLIDAIRTPENTKVSLCHKGTNAKCKQSSDTFKLQARYEELSSYAKELLNKKLIYSESYQDVLKELMGVADELTIKQLVFGTYKTEKELTSISLGKMTQDILLQLDIFKELDE